MRGHLHFTTEHSEAIIIEGEKKYRREDMDERQSAAADKRIGIYEMVKMSKENA